MLKTCFQEYIHIDKNTNSLPYTRIHGLLVFTLNSVIQSIIIFIIPNNILINPQGNVISSIVSLGGPRVGDELVADFKLAY